jgi:hypothetical protein
MQAIIERLEGLLERLKRVNYERLFVVSVLVATLTGSLYLYLVDVYFARSPDQAVAVDPASAERVAPIGRVTLAEPVIAAPAVETAAAATDAPAEASPPAEPSAEAAVAEASVSNAASTEADGSTGVAATSDASSGLSSDQAEAQAAISADPLAVQPVSAEAGGAAAPAAMPSVPSADRPIGGSAAPVGVPRPAPAYPVPPGYMPMPAQGYAPVYPSYQPPPALSRQAPGAPSWYGAPGGPYQAYPPSLYERSVLPPAGYPPQGWVR